MRALAILISFLLLVPTVALGSSRSKSRARYYRVKKGDSLQRIAKRFRVSLRALRQLNPRVKRLRRGSRIRLPKRRRSAGRRFVNLGPGPGYRLLKPERAWGTPLAVKRLREAFTAYHAQYPQDRPVYVHDLSRRRGGRLRPHRSHRTGRDVDFRVVLKRQTDKYVSASPRTLDLERTWFLVNALVSTNDVEMIFFDYRLQRVLYKHAQRQGVTEEKLQEIFQYPRGRRNRHGIIRHERGHADHLHVRFKRASRRSVPVI